MTALSFPVLLADIGGTNARFQILENNDALTVDFDIVRTADFATIEDAVRKTVLDKGYSPQTAIIAAAGPITEEGLDFTNCDWRINGPAFLSALRLTRLVLFNDFDAQALALPYLKENDLQSLGNVSLSNEYRTMGVLGAGTGLGVGTLARAAGKWVPVGGEGGHVDLGPRTEREELVWPYLGKIDGRISAEQVLSGNGLINLYSAVCRADGGHPIFQEASEISGAALHEEDPQALETLSIFCACLGRVAGDLALTNMTKGGVFIGGGIAGHILPYLEKSTLRANFDDKAPHSKLLRTIGVHVIIRDLPALLGLSGYACQPDDFAIDLDHRSWSI